MKGLNLLILILSIVSCQQQASPITASIFAPEIISSELPEFATTMNADQTEVFFNRTTPDRSSMWIMTSTLTNGEWSKPETLPFTQGLYTDVDPFLSADGKRLYFSSNRPIKDSVAGEFNTWYAERTNRGWTDAILADPPLNSDSTEIFVSMAENGNAYFVSERNKGRGIVRSRLVDGTYQPTEEVILKLNGLPIYASNPCISADESFIIVSVRPDKDTAPDLFISWNTNGNWSELQNLGPMVNTAEYAEFAPGLSKDNRTLYFTSEQPGILDALEDGIRPPGDIYVISLEKVFDQLD